MPDKFREECAVMGVYGQRARQVYLGLYALQHRGQESSGIVSSDGKILFPPADGTRRRCFQRTSSSGWKVKRHWPQRYSTRQAI
jgi:glutamine phosphoribosylpyrophosphate amidotransferase